MDNWIQSTPERECRVQQRSAAFRLQKRQKAGRSSITRFIQKLRTFLQPKGCASMPLLLVIASGMWLPVGANAQIGQLVIKPISPTNVTVGMTLTIPVSVTNTATANLVWTLG